MMQITPLTLFWLLSVGGAVVVALSRFRVRFVNEIATALAGLVLSAWLFMRGQLPLTAELIAWTNGRPLPSMTWHVDETAWQMSAWLLLLVVGGLLVRVGGQYKGGGPEAAEPNAREWPVAALVLWLTAAALTIFWADSLAGVMVGWMLLAPAWGAAHLVFITNGSEDVRRSIWAMGWLLLSLAFLWLAAANVPADANQDLVMGSWPTVATSSVLMAALLQMGVWPFYAWRMMDRRFTPLLAALMHIVPAQAGSALLLRLVASSDISMGYSLFLTAFSLLGVLLALHRAWGHLHAPTQIVAVLALAQSSLVLLAGAWAGSEALMAEARVMVLAGGVLFLAMGKSSAWFDWGRTAAVGLAVAAAGGVPLTVGFLGRSILYDVWLTQGRWMLLIVAALMHLPLITVLLVRCWPRRAHEEVEAVLPALGGRLVMASGRLLPAVGLLSFGQILPDTVAAGAWLAVLLPAAASLLLFSSLGDLREARKAVYGAFSLNLTFVDLLREAARMVVRNFGLAARQAAAILEGEGGMLWLLVLIVVFLLVG